MHHFSDPGVGKALDEREALRLLGKGEAGPDQFLDKTFCTRGIFSGNIVADGFEIGLRTRRNDHAKPGGHSIDRYLSFNRSKTSSAGAPRPASASRTPSMIAAS